MRVVMFINSGKDLKESYSIKRNGKSRRKKIDPLATPRAPQGTPISHFRGQNSKIASVALNIIT